MGAGSRADHRATIRSIPCVENHKPCVVNEAIGIFEALGETTRRKRLSHGIPREIDRPRGRKEPPAAEIVVHKETEPQQPRRTQAGVMRQHKSQRDG